MVCAYTICMHARRLPFCLPCLPFSPSFRPYVRLSAHTSVHPPIHPPVHLCLITSICPSACLSVCPSVMLYVCKRGYMSVCLSLSVAMSVRPSVCLNVWLSVQPSVYLSVCSSVRLSICPSSIHEVENYLPVGSYYMEGFINGQWEMRDTWYTTGEREREGNETDTSLILSGGRGVKLHTRTHQLFMFLMKNITQCNHKILIISSSNNQRSQQPL